VASISFAVVSGAASFLVLDTSEFVPLFGSHPARGRSAEPSEAEIPRLPRSSFGPLRALVFRQGPEVIGAIALYLVFLGVCVVLGETSGVLYPLFGMAAVSLIAIPRVPSENGPAAVEAVYSWGVDLRNLRRPPPWFLVSTWALVAIAFAIIWSLGDGRLATEAAIALSVGSLACLVGISSLFAGLALAILCFSIFLFQPWWEFLMLRPGLQLALAIVFSLISLAIILKRLLTSEVTLKWREFDRFGHRRRQILP
jgi:hypothetical protein